MAPPAGKILIALGVLLALAGIIMLYGDSIPVVRHLGRLWGDIYIEKENFRFYFPVTTCIVVSVILTLLFMLIGRFR